MCIICQPFWGYFLHICEVKYLQKDVYMDILEKIKDLTADRGWTIYKLSEASGISQSTLSNMFTRKTLPSIATLSQLCEAFNITLSEFFKEDNNNSDDEIFMLLKYRQLSITNKSIVLELINSMLKHQ